LCVAVPPKPDRPKFVSADSWSIQISFAHPPGADTSRTIIFIVEYHTHGQTVWQPLPETRHMKVTIQNLEASTHYVIRVTAKYDGGELGLSSDPLDAHTKPGKCCFKDIL